MHTLLSNRHVWWFTLVYLGSIGVLIAGGRPLEDVIGAFLILGVLLPLVALAACARMPKPPPPAPWRSDDGALLLGLLAWIVVFLLLKGPLVTALLPSAPDPRLHDTINALAKLFAFVAVPAFVLRSRSFRWSDAGLAFGVLWARTRSFVLVVALHGLFDAFSNAAPFIDTWGL